jgi:PPOX class probable F420-dependent enzyme
MNKYERVTDVGDLVELPLVATLATYRRDGTVLLSPVWHEWRDGGFNVTIEPDDVKARHIRRDARASLAVYESDPPYRGVELRGEARLVEQYANEIQRRIAERYIGKEAAEEYAPNPDDRVITLRLEPGDLRAWDFADDF